MSFPTLRDGAKSLGLNVEWQHVFVDQGTTVQPALDAVYVDVGGSLQVGVYDQHSDGAIGASSSSLVIHHPELAYQHLLGPWLRRQGDGIAVAGRTYRPRLVTHRGPDFDAVVSIVLVKYLIMEGEFPTWGNALAEYAARVDQGKYRISLPTSSDNEQELLHAVEPMHLAYLALQNLDPPPDALSKDLWLVEQGTFLITLTMEAIQDAKKKSGQYRIEPQDFDAGRPGVNTWMDHPQLAATAKHIKKLLVADFHKHLADDAERVLWRGWVRLPTAQGGEVCVPGTIMSEPPTCTLHKYWFRARGWVFTVIPREFKPPKLGLLQPTISLDAGWKGPEGESPRLYGLGAELERMEREHRTQNGGDARARIPRWPDVDNADPWYDGRGHDHTIINTPSSGTLIPWVELREYLATCLPRHDAGPDWLPSQMPTPSLGWKFPEQAPWEQAVASGELVILESVSECRDRKHGQSLCTAFPELKNAYSSELHAWLDETRIFQEPPLDLSDLLDPFDELRALLEEPTERVWSFPRASSGQTLSGDIRVLRGRVRSGVSLERLSRAMRRMPHARRVLWYIPRVQGEQAFQRRARERAEDTFAGGGLEPMHDIDQCSTRTHARAIVVRGYSAERSGSLTELAVLLAYVGFVGRALSSGAKAVLAVVDHPRRKHTADGKSGSALREASGVARDFLEFQVAYYHISIARSPETDRLHLWLREAAAIPAAYDELQDELTRLSEAEAKRADIKLQTLLFIVGLLGVVQTVDVVLGNLGRKDSFWWVSPTIVLAFLLGYLYTQAPPWMKRRPPT
jgi:hypothetical protein